MSLERFRKVYSVIPASERMKPVTVIDNETITWETAFQEISTRTSLGEKIQKRLEELEII